MRALLAALVLLLTLPAGALTQPAEERVFGVWRLSCLPPGHSARPRQAAPGQPFCRLGQIVTVDPEGRQAVLAVSADFLEGPDAPGLRFEFAAAVQRESGLALRVDDLPELRLPISGCNARICQAAGRMVPALQQRLEAGRIARVNLLTSDGRPLTVPLGLAGFREGLAALREVQPRP